MARRVIIGVGLTLLAGTSGAMCWHHTNAARPIDHTRRASVLAVNFKNFGQPRQAEHVFHESGDPGDPVRTFY